MGFAKGRTGTILGLFIWTVGIYAQPLVYPETVQDDSLLVTRIVFPVTNNVSEFSTCNLWKERPCDYLVAYSDSLLAIGFSPLMHLGIGIITNSRQIPYFNRKGLRVSGHIKQRVLFYSEFTDNQIGLPKPLKIHVDTALGTVLPHFIWTKEFDGYLSDTVLTKGVDFNDSRSVLTIVAMDKPFLAFTLGFATNQIGYGYLTPFISYRSSPYTFLQADFEYKKFRYYVLLATMKHFVGVPASKPFPNKHFVAHTVEIHVSERLVLALHEQVMMFRDTTSLFPDWNYFNPIIFYRTVEHYLGSPDNAGLGFSAMYRHESFRTWLNLFIDDLFISHLQADIKQIITGNPQYYAGSYLNKWAFSTGFAWDWNGLRVQWEYMRIRPFTYSHSSILQNFAHYGYGIAHPKGANLWETLLKATYTIGKLEAGTMFAVMKQGIDTGKTNYGADIFKNFKNATRYYGNYTNQGVPVITQNFHFWIAYSLNKTLTLEIYAQFRKSQSTLFNEQYLMTILSLNWNLFNPYRTLWWDW